MQDRYAGDVGDFGKLVFLRALMEMAGGRHLGINWYRTTRPERSSNDGRHVSYLDASRPNNVSFEACDPPAYNRLTEIVNGMRSVAALEQSALFPPATLFYSAPIPHESSGSAARLAERNAWLEDSRSSLKGAQIIFLDPDNGIQPSTARKGEPRAVKYAFLDEMAEYYKQCQLLIVYHHRDRSPAPRYASKFLTARKKVDPAAQLRVLRFRRFSVRDYVFFFKPAINPVVRRLFAAMTTPPYDFLFTELLCE